MEIFWLPSGTPFEFNAARHLADARQALYWEVGPAGLMVLFPTPGDEERRSEAVFTALPRRLQQRPRLTGIADLTLQCRIDWHSYRYGFTTPPDIQQKMRYALFGI